LLESIAAANKIPRELIQNKAIHIKTRTVRTFLPIPLLNIIGLNSRVYHLEALFVINSSMNLIIIYIMSL